MNLDKLPNIGKVLVSKLEKVGIKSVDDLKKAGSKNAFLRIRTHLNDG